MLPSSFEHIAEEHPELRTVLGRISQWIRAHQDWNVLDTRILARDLADVDALLLAAALHVLSTGPFRRAYMITTPSGVLFEEQFDDPRQIPDRVPDRFNRYFDTAESDIVPVLKAR